MTTETIPELTDMRFAQLVGDTLADQLEGFGGSAYAIAKDCVAAIISEVNAGRMAYADVGAEAAESDKHGHDLPIGTILTLTEGEYSYYETHGPYRVIKAFARNDIVRLFKNTWKGTGRHPTTNDFRSFLLDRGYIEQVLDAQEWYLGSARFNPAKGGGHA